MKVLSVHIVVCLAAILSCSSNETEDNLVKISPKLKESEIREQLLDYTPFGTKSDEVAKFIDNRLYRRIYHENKSRPRLLVEIKNEPWRLKKIKQLEWWPDQQQPGGIIPAALNYYGFMPSTVVTGTWYFNSKMELIEIKVEKSTGPP